MIDVSCALIIGHNKKILVAQRSSGMRLPLKWEFPGGKVETGESAEECLIRELTEELAVVVDIVKAMLPYTHEEQGIRLIPFLCTIKEGEISLAEHAAYRWMEPLEIKTLDLADADIPVLQQYLDGL